MTHSFVKCEAVKVSYRQTKDGMVVAFAIHPNDMPPELALAPVGTRVLLAVAEIVEGEPAPEPAPKPSSDRSEKAREAYAMKDKMAQAASRAAMLCKDRAFQSWIATHPQAHTHMPSEWSGEEAAACDMRLILGITSRSQIASNETAYELFLALELEYKASQGQFAENRA